MPARLTRGSNVYLVGRNGVTEIANGQSKNSRPTWQTPVIVSVSTGLPRRVVADILSDLVKYIRGSHKNARASRAKGARPEKIYMDLS